MPKIRAWLPLCMRQYWAELYCAVHCYKQACSMLLCNAFTVKVRRFQQWSTQQRFLSFALSSSQNILRHSWIWTIFQCNSVQNTEPHLIFANTDGAVGGCFLFYTVMWCQLTYKYKILPGCYFEKTSFTLVLHQSTLHRSVLQTSAVKQIQAEHKYTRFLLSFCLFNKG